MFIRPDIFSHGVTAFFTTKATGTDTEKISRAFSVKKEDIYMPIQRHTDIILLLNHERTPVTADAVVTRERSVLIGVQVADCIPVLLFDRGRSVIGVVHAGWRGTSLQIVRKTVLFMVDIFGSDPDDIMVAFGPSIRGCCYHVDAEVKDGVFMATGEGNYVVPEQGKYRLDLVRANTIQVRNAGVRSDNIWISPECTFCNPRVFHSYRYHKNYAGRQAGFIGIF